MNITVISDKHNLVRRNNVVKVFGKKNLNFRFFDAVMANRMSEKDVAAAALENTFLSVEEIGCALSHRAVYDMFLQSDDNSLLICEDDIYFTPSFNMNVVSAVADFVEASDEPRLVVLQKSIYHRKKIKELDMGICIYSARNLFGAYGYILNRSAADNIRHIQTPVRFEIDAFKFYYWLNACNLYCLNKDLILPANMTLDGTEPMKSTVTKNWCSDRKKRKDRAYKELYNRLSLKGKMLSQVRRLEKAIYRPFETLDY